MTGIAEQPGVRRGPQLNSQLQLSLYERVASLLLALIVLLGALVAILFAVWWTSRIPPRPAAVPVIIEDVTGGFEGGVFGESMEIEGPITGEIGEQADPADQQFQQTLALVADSVATQQVALDDPQLIEDVEATGLGGSRGTGNALALGEGGGGTGGVRRGQRWIIRFQEGGSLDAYAQQLDFFGIELGVVGGQNEILYARNLTRPQPETRRGGSDQEQRLYFSWQDGSRQEADRQLLSQAGIAAEGKLVIQFYPADVENQLATIEMQYLQENSGRDIRLVRRTHFGVRAVGSGYEFYVREQTFLGR